jgi:hypothetical protein
MRISKKEIEQNERVAHAKTELLKAAASIHHMAEQVDDLQHIVDEVIARPPKKTEFSLPRNPS